MADISKKDRANRSLNFTKAEEDFLLKSVLKRKSIIECKLTDGQTTKSKNATWEEIATECNAAYLVIPRATKVLRDKYTSIKRSLRKNVANERTQRLATGGGKAPAEFQPANEILAELAETISMSINGLNAVEGDDDFYPASLSTTETFYLDESESEKVVLIEEIEQLPISEITPSEKQIVSSSPIEIQDCSTSAGPSDGIDSGCNQPDAQTTKIFSQNKQNEKWDKYNPAMLRKPISTVLKRPNRLRDKSIAGDSTIEIRKKILKRDLEMAEEAHKIDIENRELERDERRQRIQNAAAKHSIEIQILKAELDIALKNTHAASSN